MANITKSLIALAVIAVCAVLIFFGYHWFNIKNTQKKVEIDTTKTTIVTQLIAIGNLETARMSMQKIIEGKQGFEDLLPGKKRDNLIQSFFFGDKMELVAYAEVIAGFDISHLSTGAISINSDKSISIVLPIPKILSSYLTKDTKPFIRQTGIFTNGNTQLETEIRNKALEVMTEEAIKKGILEEAIKNASGALTPLLQNIGYTIKHISIQSGDKVF